MFQKTKTSIVDFQMWFVWLRNLRYSSKLEFWKDEKNKNFIGSNKIVHCIRKNERGTFFSKKRLPTWKIDSTERRDNLLRRCWKICERILLLWTEWEVWLYNGKIQEQQMISGTTNITMQSFHLKLQKSTRVAKVISFTLKSHE